MTHADHIRNSPSLETDPWAPVRSDFLKGDPAPAHRDFSSADRIRAVFVASLEEEEARCRRLDDDDDG